ncbi:hypothetical protein PhCBS80983_g03913 [Powellomyces hirtus]|uniref:Phosphatidic acid phosphatase type 2/haloperoxidase domain-containing protein n=1 Tax=Powellomyces hirtus TaxID=109895 RepID=A0A507E0Q9_9FUNG|nr:hypothetical protein PhCBS80983_g03913 [Powellomyces hirtus]
MDREHRNPSAATIPDASAHHHVTRQHAPRREPPFTMQSYIRAYWMDYLVMAAMGALGLGIYMLRPAPNRLFPIYFRDGEVVYPEFAYPLRKNIIPIWLAAFLAFTIPFVFFMLAQIRVRSFVDANAATMGVIMSLVTAAVFQVFLKWLIGGLRPHFYAVCKPVIDPSLANAGQGFSGIMVDRSVCTGDDKEINDALESFPSGHSTASWAGLLFLAYYLNGKLKVFANYRPQFWKLVLFFAPILGATLISASLTIDEYHHYYDVIGGSIIGSVVATATYRFQYASLFDYRFNHIPLPRITQTGFRYALGQGSDMEAEVHPATRKAGWGNPDDNVAGAPGDAMWGPAAGLESKLSSHMRQPHQELPI